MKIVQKIIVFAFILASIAPVYGQYGNNGYGNTGYGNNNDMSQVNHPPVSTPREPSTEEIITEMKPALELDELQTIVITNVLEEAKKKKGRILKAGFNPGEQENELQSLTKTTEQNINQYLSKEQKEKYLLYKEESKAPKKSNKKKR